MPPLKPFIVFFRILELVWATIIMALIGSIIDLDFSNPASVVNYNLFVPAFTMFTMIYLLPAAFSSTLAIHPILTLVIDILNTIFALCGAVALPSKLHVHSCSNEKYTTTNIVTGNAPDTEQTCRQAQAATAFLWFLFAAFVISTVLTGLQTRGSMVDMRGPRPGRRTQPSMSQV